jgi:hypothetical protein
MGNPPLATGDRPLAEGHVMPSVDVKLAEGDYTEKQRHEMTARLQTGYPAPGPLGDAGVGTHHECARQRQPRPVPAHYPE